MFKLAQPDESLPGMSWLLDASSVQDRMASRLGAGNELAINQIKYKPGTSCLVSYHVPGQSGFPRLHAKVFCAESWDARRESLIGLDHRDVAVDDLMRTVYFVFPYDARLPVLEDYGRDPERMIARVLKESVSTPIRQVVELTYKPNRRYTAGIELQSGRRFVVKFHDRTTYSNVLRSARLTRQLPAGLCPERIGRSNRYQALAFEWIDGKPLALAGRSESDLSQVFGQIMEMLSKIQLPLRSGRRSIPGNELLNEAIHAVQFIRSICPPLAGDAKRAMESIGQLTEPSQDVLLHGDFYSKQLIASESSIRVCDFDNCCAGSRTADLANFVAHLQLQNVFGQLPKSTVELFDAISESHFGSLGSPGGQKEYRRDLALSLARLASHPFRKARPDWTAETNQMLNAVELAASEADRKSIGSAGEARLRINGSATCKDSLDQLPLNDRAFRFIQDAFCPTTATRLLKREIPAIEQAFGDFEVIEAEVLKHKKGRRCLIEFHLDTGQGQKLILGKASARRLDRRSYQTQTTLFDSHGFGGDAVDAIRVPRTFGASRKWQMWFQEKVDATAGSKLGEKQLDGICLRTARTLAKLHSSNYSPSREYSIHDEMLMLYERLRQVASVVPALSKDILVLLDRCEQISAMIPTTSPVPIHRDFYFDQIMFSDKATYLVDLDLVAAGDPAQDVGNLLAHISEDAVRKFGDFDHHRDFENRILNEYIKAMPHQSKAAIGAWKAISFVRHVSISRHIRERRKHTRRIVQAAIEMCNQQRELTPTT